MQPSGNDPEFVDESAGTNSGDPSITGGKPREPRQFEEPCDDLVGPFAFDDEGVPLYPEDESAGYCDQRGGLDIHSWGCWDGECYACGWQSRVNTMGLCEECAEKLERDLIRERAWDHSVEAYGLPAERREVLRRRVVNNYGEQLELIAPAHTGSKKVRAKRKRK